MTATITKKRSHPLKPFNSHLHNHLIFLKATQQKHEFLQQPFWSSWQHASSICKGRPRNFTPHQGNVQCKNPSGSSDFPLQSWHDPDGHQWTQWSHHGHKRQIEELQEKVPQCWKDNSQLWQTAKRSKWSGHHNKNHEWLKLSIVTNDKLPSNSFF